MTNIAIFDLDGTIVDSAPGIVETLKTTLHHFGLLDHYNYSTTDLGLPLPVLLRRYFQSNPHSYLDALDMFASLYDTCGYKQSFLYPGIVELLEYLRSVNYTLVILTNKRELPTNRILNKCDLSLFFDHVLCTPSSPFSHCDKGSILLKLKTTILTDGKHMFYAGDMLSDLISARRSLVKFYYAKWGYGNIPNTTLLKTGSYAVANPKDLLPYIMY